MRKAMFMSGHLRCIAETAAAAMKNEFDGDIFIATWDRMDVRPDAPLIDTVTAQQSLNATRLEVCNFDSIMEMMKIKEAYIKKYRTANYPYKGRTEADTFCLWHLAQRSWLLLKEHEKKTGVRYDWVVRFRPDYIFKGLPADFAPQNGVVYFPTNVTRFNCPQPIGTTDNLFIADRDTMEIMMTLPSLVDTYLLREGTPWVMETLILHQITAHNLVKENLPGLLYHTASGLPPGGEGSRPDYLFNQHKKALIVATMVVYNEEDILAECIHNTFNEGVDKILLIDGDSDDRTLAIAKDIPGVEIFEKPEERRGKCHSWLAQIAMEMGADWIVPMEADELWTGIANLTLVPAHFNVALAGQLYHHRPTDIIGSPFRCSQMPIFEPGPASNNSFRYGRFAFRPLPGAHIGVGRNCHDQGLDLGAGWGPHESARYIMHADAPLSIGGMNEMWVHWYPIRGYEQYVKKVHAICDVLGSNPAAGLQWRTAKEKLKYEMLHGEYHKHLIKLLMDDPRYSQTSNASASEGQTRPSA